MVEDSIAKKFSGSPVSVAGVDMRTSTDSEIKQVIDATSITFPLAKNGGSIGSAYLISNGAYAVGIVVIDKDGIMRFVQRFESGESSTTYNKMVSDAASTVRSLLSTGIARPKATPAFAGHNGNTMRYYTLSGQTIAHPITSEGSCIVLRRLDGRVTGVARFARLNP
jgi:hypothetical protein